VKFDWFLPSRYRLIFDCAVIVDKVILACVDKETAHVATEIQIQVRSRGPYKFQM
jgi:hypothetical protein